MSKSSSSSPPPSGGVAVSGTTSTSNSTSNSNSAGNVVLDADAIGRAVRRMAHEIVERNHGTTDVVVVGLLKGGAWLAQALAESLDALHEQVPHGTLDVSFYRDDLGLRPVTPSPSLLPFEVDDKIVVLVDDVLYTGRTVRAALDALRAYGRPKSVQLAVMVDRGHRELPIRPDFVGKNLPTSRTERVVATPEGVVIA